MWVGKGNDVRMIAAAVSRQISRRGSRCLQPGKDTTGSARWTAGNISGHEDVDAGHHSLRNSSVGHILSLLDTIQANEADKANVSTSNCFDLRNNLALEYRASFAQEWPRVNRILHAA